MKIIERSLNEASLKDNEYQDIYTILVDGDEKISASDYGEPEDNSLGRDLNFVYDIVPLMKQAYEAGKRGEEFEIEREFVSE